MRSILVRVATASVASLWAATALAAELVIAQVAPFSGPLAPTGTHMRAGAQLYFDRVNAAGGVHGATIRLVSQDDGYKVPETVAQTRRLLQQSKPLALFGYVGTGNVSALVREKILDKEGIPAIGIRTGATSLIEPPHPWLFIGRSSYATEVEKMLQQLSTMGVKRVGVFYQDDPFGMDGRSAAETAAPRWGIELTVKAGYEKNTTKVEPAAEAIAKANPQGVIMVSNTAASAAFVKAYRARGGDGMLIALSTTDGPQVVRTIGKETARGLGIAQVVPDPRDRSLLVVRELQDAYRAAAPKDVELNHTLLQGYIGAKLLVEGLRRAGPNPTRDRLREAMESLRDHDLGGLDASFSPKSHAGLNYVDITVLDREGQILR